MSSTGSSKTRDRPALNKAQQAALSRASSTAITNAFGQIMRRHLPNGRWIAKSNRYRTSILRTLETDFKGAPDSGQLAQYLAASSFHHCADGWSFLGRALHATLAGDDDAARHLGYYAELRAAVGILATQGIGIFNRTHAVVDASRNAKLVKGQGTHIMAWLVLPQWAKTLDATAALARIVAPFGVPLDRWASVLPGAGAFRPVAEEWLELWGLDLKVLALDRDSRNESSYQPSRINERERLDATSAAEFVVELWNTLEPSGPNDPFATLDLQLLRRGLEAAFHAAGRRIDPNEGSEWSAAIDSAVEEAVGEPVPFGLREFLRRSDPDREADSAIFEHAEARRDLSHPEHHLGVLSRASLLLRMCSGYVSESCAASGVSRTHVDFWLDEFATARGLWPEAPLPDPVTDLYDELSSGVQDLAQLIAANDISSYYELRLKGGDALLALSGCERVALWSIAA
jgi:hypothetical protein